MSRMPDPKKNKVKPEDKLREIHPEKISEFTKAVLSLRSELGPMVEYQQLLAQLRKSSYDAHIEQGFTAVEALELCKQVMS